MKAVFWFSIAVFLAAFILLGVGANEVFDRMLGWDAQLSWEAGRITAFLIILASASLVIAFVTGLLRLIGAGIGFVVNTMPTRAGRAPAEGEGAPPRVTTTPLDVLVALAIVVICFQSLANGLYLAALDAIWTVFAAMPGFIVQPSYSIQACDPSMGMGASCFVSHLEVVIRPLIESAREILSQRGVRALPAGTLVVALALWAILIYVIASARQPNSWWRTMSPTRKRTGAYLALAVFSSYIAISALLAFALFDRDQDQDVASEADLDKRAVELEQNLWKIYGGEPRIPEQAFLPGPDAAPMNLQNQTAFQGKGGRIEAAEAPAFDPAPQPMTADGVETITRAQSYYRAAEATFAVNAGMVPEAQIRTDRFFKALVTRITQIFKSRNRGRLGQRELSDHEARLLDWFAYTTFEARNRLATCRSRYNQVKQHLAVVKADAEARVVIEPAQEQEFAVDPVTEQTFFYAPSPSNPIDNYQAFKNSLTEAQTACGATVNFDASIPARDSYGKSLGPVAVWTSWLLSGESKQVSLIIGLIGFGLLGATASNYFRPARTGPNGEDEDGGATASLYEISSVFVKGFVAAIVVYLTATGGLAIVGDQTGGTPNPYVVFAACLVGAVFSEDVWTRARDRFFGDRNGGNGAAGDGI